MSEQTNHQGRNDPSIWWRLFFAATLLVAVSGAAQTLGKAPTLSIAPVPLTTAQRAQATMVNLNFRVPPGYHINSNTPKSEFLIPTALKMVAVHPLKSVSPGKYVIHGVLRYQACDNAACYPPKTLPVSFDVKVVKEPPEHHANPAQSPHVHN
jgi:hypothetical protein